MAYITVPSVEEARRIGRHLVENRLAACVNIIPFIESCYWWNGEVASDTEAVVLAKTLPEMADTLAASVREIHPYEVPAILFLQTHVGSPPFFKWMKEEIPIPPSDKGGD